MRKKELFYSHVNYSVTKIGSIAFIKCFWFYSHVNYSVTKINLTGVTVGVVLQSRKLFSY